MLVMLAACAQTQERPRAAIGEPRLESDAIVAADGARLPLKVWLPEDGSPKAVILALHGYGDYSNAFARPAPYLVHSGIAVYAYDQRGFGAAPDPGIWAGTDVMTEDAAVAARLVAGRHPGVPLYLLGESMGGAVAMRAMARADAPPVAGVILVAPAVWARSRMNVFERVALWLGSHALPWMSVSGRGLDITPSDNTEMLRELGRDPLVQKDSRIDTIDGLADLMDAAYDGGPELRGPALILYGERDEVVPSKPVYEVMALLERRSGIVDAVYPKGYHMLLRDLQATTVLGDIVAWIGRHNAPLPSGADRRAGTVLAELRPAPVAALAEEPN